MNTRVLMRCIATLVVLSLVQLCAKVNAWAVQGQDTEIAQIVAQSQQALAQHDEQKALSSSRKG